MMDLFKIIDVGDWPVVGRESRGKRTKAWIRDSGERRWLRKEPLQSRPAELAIEVSVLKLARAAGLAAAEAECAVWLEQGDARRGCVVRNFVEDPTDEFSEGADVLSGASSAYDSEDYTAHTPSLVRDACQAHPQLAPVARQLRTALLDVFIFDAWVGNGDRHPGNWGVLRSPGTPARLAPMYDPAACLGAELQDDHRLLDPNRRKDAHLEQYVVNCPTGFGDGIALIRQPQLIEQLRTWPEWTERLEVWLPKFEELNHAAVSGYFRSVPDEWLGPERKWLAQELLHRRLQWLRKNA